MGSLAPLNTGWSYSIQNSSSNKVIITRPLTALEQFLTILNDRFCHQNSPYIGATLTIPTTSEFDIVTLRERAETAFQQTRWTHPTIACKVAVNGTEIMYTLENEVEIKEWSKRTVHIVESTGGWLTVQEKVSKEDQWPTASGDCCEVYIISSAKEARKFDILIHFHHALIDGSGARTVLNEFLTRLADPTLLQPKWGEEVARLYPCMPDLLNEEEKKATVTDIPLSEVMKDIRSMFLPDDGLPLYRPDIFTVLPENRGSSLVTHTFESPEFLQNILHKCRQNNAKLAAILLACLFQVTYEFAERKPQPGSKYNIFCMIDQRNNNRMIAPYSERNHYVSMASASEQMVIEADLMKRAAENGDFWELVRPISEQFAEAAMKKGIAGTHENRTRGLITELPKVLGTQAGEYPKPQTTPYYISDPPGEDQLSDSYPVRGTSSKLELDSFQVFTEENLATICARSHSWKGKLTLCLSFNATRIPKAEAEKLLVRWREVIKKIPI